MACSLRDGGVIVYTYSSTQGPSWNLRGRRKKPNQQNREVDGEPRWQTIGVVNGIHVLLVAHTVVAHTVNEYDEEIRIVSARKATRSERRLYAQRK